MVNDAIIETAKKLLSTTYRDMRTKDIKYIAQVTLDLLDRVKVLEKENEHLSTAIMMVSHLKADELLSSSDKDARIREFETALKFYANPSDYKAPLTGGLGKLYYDCGGTARAALASITPGEKERQELRDAENAAYEKVLEFRNEQDTLAPTTSGDMSTTSASSAPDKPVIAKDSVLGEWQPIETAPQDGSRIFVTVFPAHSYAPIELVWWSESKRTRKYFGHTAAWRVGRGNKRMKILHWNPTHWMPLPAPPTSESPTGEK